MGAFQTRKCSGFERVSSSLCFPLFQTPSDRSISSCFGFQNHETECYNYSFYSPKTIEKLVTRRGVLYCDEFSARYELPRLCPRMEGSYLYQSSGLMRVEMSFLYRPGINMTLVRELDKR